MNELLRAIDISKSFPGVQALDKVSLSVKKGEVKGLVGENGAGKSTLIKIITGAYEKDSGRIFFLGREIHKNNPILSRQLGIFAVYQDVLVAPDLSVAENLFLGFQPLHYGIINWKDMLRRSKKLLKEMGLDIEPDTPIRYLSLSQREMVAIAKILLQKPRLVIFDEPTAVLATNEKLLLFEIIRKLKQQDVGIIYISHNLEEVFEICDTITVLKDGKVVGDFSPEEIKSVENLIPLMVGRKIEDMYSKQIVSLGQEILRVENLTTKKVKDITFSLREGEILGFYGLVGSGRTEIAKAIFGLDKIESGKIFVKGKEVSIKNPLDAIRNGISYLPEDRKGLGLFLPQNVEFNINIINYKDLLSYLFMINIYKAKELARSYVEKLGIKTPSIDQLVFQLSGGNQQKVILARWLSRIADILILDEPTVGIDVGAKAEIYKLMGEIVRQGKGVIFISSYLPELIGICDRILVISNGKIAGELIREEFSEELLLTLAMKYVKEKEALVK